MGFDIQPFLEAERAIQIHVIAALFALFTGIYIFSRRKGGKWHKRIGKGWVVAMALVALSSLFINQLKVWGPFSPLHLLSLFVLGSLVYAIAKVRAGDVQAHRFTMIGLFVGGLLVAGALTFARDLLMHRIFFPGNSGAFIPSPAEWPGGPVVFALSSAAMVFAGVLLYAFWSNRASRNSA